MEKIKVGIIGSRKRNTPSDKKAIRKSLKAKINFWGKKNITIVSGGCPEGGDRFAEELAEEFKLPIIIHWPDKKLLPEKPKKWDYANMFYARNTLIARDSDLIIACVTPERKGGTEDTIKKFRKKFKDQGKDMMFINYRLSLV
jgi:hypothetical protein